MEFEAVFFFFGFDVSVLDDPNDVIHGLLTRMPSFQISKTFAHTRQCALKQRVYRGNPESWHLGVFGDMFLGMLEVLEI